MAATMSPWAKPGAWALDSEEHDAELEQQAKDETHVVEKPLADFPSLAAAAAAKPKKKKGQTITLAEFSTYSEPKPAAYQHAGLTHQDRLVLPTGPRERTAEELDRSRLGGGFRSYGSGDRGGGRYGNSDESSNSKWGSSTPRKEGGGFGNESNRDGPSRADEIDDWGAAKKSMVGNGFERRERSERGERGERGGFFGSQSKADESDSWVSNKSSVVSSEGRRFGASSGGFDRERKVGFASNGGGADSDSWGRKKEESNGGTGFDRERKVGFASNGGGADSDTWGKKREESSGGTESSSRPRLNLQPRTLPVAPVSSETSPGSATAPKPKGSNPFGEARPREEVLAEKGQDWKKIDEQLESVKIKEVAADGESFGKRSFGVGFAGDRTERAWRKPDVVDARPQSAEKNESRSDSEEPENGHVDEN